MEDKTAKLREEAYGPIMEHMRVKHPDLIDTAYEFFWEEEYPEDFLSGLALELAFMNFEDWFVCDYLVEGKESVIDLYLRETGRNETTDLRAMKESVINFYEVRSITGNVVELGDFIMGEDLKIESSPMEGMKPGDVFAARFVKMDGPPVMGACLYPFPADMKTAVLSAMNGLFIRYKKNKNPDGGPGQFLKDEAYSFNMIWMSNIYKGVEGAGAEEGGAF